jgi:hypothetical protein
MSELTMPEQEDPRIQPLVELSITAAQVLSTRNVPAFSRSDGSAVRNMRAHLTSSRYAWAELSEVAPADGGPTLYEYSFATHDRPIDTQLLTWTDGKSAITHSVRSTLFPEAEPQFVKDIEPSETNVLELKERIDYLGMNYGRLVASVGQEAHRPRRGVGGLLGRLAAGNVRRAK